MSNPYIYRQPYQQITTSATPTSLVGSRLNDNAPPETNFCHPQHNDHSQYNGHSVRFIHPTSSLNDNAAEFIPRNSQHNVLSGRAIGEQHHNPWLNPAGGADNYAGAFLQTQQQNYWQNPTEYVAYQHTGDFLQTQQQNLRQNSSGYESYQHGGDFLQYQQQNLRQNSSGYESYQHGGNFLQYQQQNSWKTTAECEASDRHHQQFLQDAVIRKLQNPPPGFANKTQQKNSTTDKQVNTFIQKITDLYNSGNKDISKQVSACFNYFKKEASCLTDDHRKQLLSIIPTIGEIIDKKNLDHISIITILYSLAKTEVFCKMNPNNTSENECIRYEQESINLIDKILTKILQTPGKHSEMHWSNIFYALSLLAKQSPNLITSEQINNLMANLNIQKQSLTEFNHLDISDIFVTIVKLLKHNKLDSSSIATHSFLTYLLQQIKPVIGNFNTQSIASTLLSIGKLTNFSDFIQLISDKQDIIELLLENAITNNNLNWKPRDVSQVIYTLGIITEDIYLNKKVASIVKLAYNTLYSKVSFTAPKYDISSAHFLLCGIIKLIKNNVITSNKPSKSIIRGIFLEKIIADTSIINNKDLYQYLHTIANFQAYLTKNELIKILENINFFIPDINDAKVYFTTMGYLLAKIRKELNNDKENKDLLNLEHKVTTEIKKVYRLFHDNIENVNQGTKNSMHNTCSLVDGITNLDYLKPKYNNFFERRESLEFENTYLGIIKTLMPNPENLQQEYLTNNLPPIDVCITYPSGRLLAIEIQGPGHYIDNEGEYPTGKHLLKMARLQKENIKVIEVNTTTLMDYKNHREIAAYLINLLLENHVEIRPEYKDNIPQLLQDAGITS